MMRDTTSEQPACKQKNCKRLHEALDGSVRLAVILQVYNNALHCFTAASLRDEYKAVLFDRMVHML